MEYWIVGVMGTQRILPTLLLVAWMIGSPSCVEVVAAKPITLAYQTPTLGSNLPIFIAVELGLFATENLEVKTVFIQGGPTAMAALLGGDVDYVKVAGVPAARAIAQGTPLVIAGGFQPYIDYTLIGAKKITTLNDLRGKIVGVTGAGGIAEFATVEGLARKGLVRDRDYSVLYAGNSPARVNALESGVIHAGAFSANEKVVMEERGFPLLLETGKALPEFPFMVIVTYRQKLKNNPAEVVAFLRALRSAMSVIQNSKDKVIAAAAKKDPNANVNVLRKSLDYTLDSFSIALGKKNIQALVSAAKLNVNLDAPGSSEKFFVDEFLTRALSAK